MIKSIKLAQAAAAVAFTLLAVTAKAENSDSGGGPFESGAPAAIYLTGPGDGSESGGTLPLAQRNLGAPAIVSIGAPHDSAYDNGSGDDIWLAAKMGGDKQLAATDHSAGTH